MFTLGALPASTSASGAVSQPNTGALEESILFPHISDWLGTLDSDPVRGADNRNFTQYAQRFTDHGFLRLNELLDELVSVDSLAQWLGVGRGVIVVILKYAKADVEKARRDARGA